MSKSIKKLNSNKPQIKNNDSHKKYYYLTGIIILTIFIYINTIHNGFIYGWDDDVYVAENRDIMMFTFQGFKTLSSNFYIGLYLPVTMFSYALEYKLFGMNPAAFHAVNLILHLINAVLVFFLIQLIFKKTNIALISALLFAIHPMHVESVVWISERKDLLYTLFYLASIIFYLKYINYYALKIENFELKEKRSIKIKRLKCYLISILFFSLSLLSKSMAVTLPIILMLIDFFKERVSINSKFIIIRNNNFFSNMLTKSLYLVQNLKFLEKLPFFILSLGFGLLNIVSQDVVSAAEYNKAALNFSIVDRFFMLCYSISFYIVEFLLPIKLSAIHPFPVKINGILPISYYLSPFIIAAIVFLVYKFKKFRRIMLFGILFFLISISVVLILPVGFAIVAERYTYVPYIGFFIILAYFFEYIKQKYASSGLSYNTAVFILTLYCIVFSYITYSRTTVWKDGITLFTDIIDKYPKASFAYNSRGNLLMNEPDKAIEDFNKAIELDPYYSSAYNNRGNIKLNNLDFVGAINDFDKAIVLNSKYVTAMNNRALAKTKLNNFKAAMLDYDKAIAINPDYKTSYFNRATLKEILNDQKGAMKDYNKAIALNPYYEQAYINRGKLKEYLDDTKEAIEDYNKVISINSTNELAFNNRANLKLNSNDYKGAIEDVNKAIALNPNYALAYCNRAWIKENIKDYEGAMNDINNAINLSADNPMQYYIRGLIYEKLLKYDLALQDYNKAILLNPNYSEAYLNRGIVKIYLKQTVDVCQDFNKSLQLGNSDAQKYILQYCNK